MGVQGWPFPRRRPASARVSVSLLDPLWLGVARIEDLKKEEELSSVVVWICIDGLIGRSERFSESLEKKKVSCGGHLVRFLGCERCGEEGEGEEEVLVEWKKTNGL